MTELNSVTGYNDALPAFLLETALATAAALSLGTGLRTSVLCGAGYLLCAVCVAAALRLHQKIPYRDIPEQEDGMSADEEYIV